MEKTCYNIFNIFITSVFNIFLAAFASFLTCQPFGSSSKGERLNRMLNSPNYKDGAFVNEIKTPPTTKNRFALAMKFFFVRNTRREPERTPAIIKLNSSDFANPPKSGFRVTWLGHSSIFIEMGAKTILIDPVLSERASPFQWIGPKRFHPAPIAIQDLPKIDIVLISHDHYDHLDYGSIKKLKEKTELFIAPLGVGAHLESWGVQAQKIRELYWWEKQKVGQVEFICTPARHFSGRGLFDRNESLWASWVIRDSKNRIYYSGDTGPMPAFKKIGLKYGPFHLSLIQLGAYGKSWPYIHMTPEEAVKAHKELRANLLLPVHWGTFNLGLHSWDAPLIRTKKAAKAAKVPYLLPRPGQRISIDGSSYLPKAFPEYALTLSEEKKAPRKSPKKSSGKPSGKSSMPSYFPNVGGGEISSTFDGAAKSIPN